MFTIFTESPTEKNLLEQDYATLNDRFHIKLQQSPAIAGILRSISYELFQSSPPQLAEKVTKMAVESLHLKLSLALYRQILSKIKKTEELITLYRDYFISLSRITEDPFAFQCKQSYFEFNQETSAIYDLQCLETYPEADMLITDFQDQLQQAIGKNTPNAFEKTRKTGILELTPYELPFREKLELTNNQLFSCCEESGAEWWKLKQRDDLRNSSKEISRFERHRQNLLQNTISSVLQEQAKYQQERQQELARKSKRTEESLYLKFNKKMREKLMNAKLKKRRRR